MAGIPPGQGIGLQQGKKALRSKSRIGQISRKKPRENQRKKAIASSQNGCYDSPMSKFNRWSNSSLTTLQVCGHKFYLRYIKRDFRQSGPGAKRGIAIHAIAKEAHKRQMVDLGRWQGEEPLFKNLPGTGESIKEARDLAADQFEQAWKDGVVLSKDDKEIGEAKVKAAQKDTAVDLAGLYVSDVAPTVVPAAVERKVEIRPKDMDIVVMGHIDLVEDDATKVQDPESGLLTLHEDDALSSDVIRDLKTAEKKPWKGAAAVSQQLTLYHLIRLADKRIQNPEANPKSWMPRKGRLVHLVRTPIKHEMSVVVQETERDMDDIRALVNRIKTAVAAVERGVFVPADPAAPGSPCGYCEYADGTCEYVRKIGRPIPKE